jgi:hypothetical protein
MSVTTGTFEFGSMSPLLWIFQFAFGVSPPSFESCVHNQEADVQSLLLDCGRELELPDAHPSSSVRRSSGTVADLADCHRREFNH